MRLLSVNLGRPKDVTHKGKVVRTGIYKEPVEGRVTARTLNLDGDGQADLAAHGGEMRAVLVYSMEDYEFWARELGRDDFAAGQFGENFTVDGMPSAEVRVGDKYRIGTALFEVSQPRVPCYKLAMKMGVEGFYAQLLESGRPGFYFRVLEEGEVGAGDTIELVARAGDGFSIRDMSNLLYFDKDDLEGARRALSVEALSPGWKQSFETRLAKAAAAGKTQERFQTLVVTKKERESESITSFYLVREDREPLTPFLPGQFLPLRLDIPGQYRPAFRTYSLSDAPGCEYYRLTVKREEAPPNQPDAYPGVASNFLHDDVAIGSTLLAKAPRGRFFLDPEREGPVCLVSAGVGLTPLVSMLRAIAESGSRRPVWFLHGTRSGRTHALRAPVRDAVERCEQARQRIWYSQPEPEDVVGEDYDETGHVDAVAVQNAVGEAIDACEFFLCGPTPFLRSLLNGLLDLGVAEHRIHYEFFGPASELLDRSRIAKAKARAGADARSETIEVTFSESNISTPWNPSLDSILDLAEAVGLTPDYSCRSGVCQTCVSELVEGEVDYVLEPLDPPEEGEVLICCSRPTTNVVVKL